MTYPKIKELREKNKLTQQQAAEKLNLPLPTYRSYETGAREPGVDVLIKLSELYDVTTDYLLDHKPSHNSHRRTKDYYNQWFAFVVG